MIAHGIKVALLSPAIAITMAF